MAPRCLAIIPDGNRRAARKHGWPGFKGHHEGLVNGRTIAQAAFEKNVEHVVFWGASRSNLENRSRDEVENLFELLKLELKSRLLRTDKVRFRLCGAWRAFTSDQVIVDLCDKVEERTSSFNERHLTLLFGYDGEDDVAQAAQKLFDAGTRPTKELIRSSLWTGHLPDVDLLIRTGVEGDPHDSDAFLPLQRRHTQLYLTDCCWPDFTQAHLLKAFDAYGARERRKGA